PCPSTLLLWFIVLYCDRPASHSFPTRRSSDLPQLRLRHHLIVMLPPCRKPGIGKLSIIVRLHQIGLCDLAGEIRPAEPRNEIEQDRKSTRLNSSHVKSSYAVFCFKI